MPPASRRRQFLLPLIILLIAAAIGWWGSRQRAGELAAVEAAVVELIRGDLPADASELPPGLPRLLETLRTEGLGDASRTDVLVSTDRSGTGATHAAEIRLDGRPRLGLRLAHGGDGGTRVTGYWRED